LLYLHKIKHWIHRDLKPGNILINSEGIVKLTDFGIARSLENTFASAKTFIGTSTHLSPERMIGKEYSFDSDIWSLGLIVFELATGIFPYQQFVNTPILLINTILKDPPPSLDDDPNFSSELKDFINRCLQKEPKDRDTAAELCVFFILILKAHPWILKYSDEEANLQDWIADLYDIVLI
jgi:mitogen-activated protein kinase kinase 1